MKLKDDDYILEDDCAWFEVAGFAVRLAYQSGSLAIGVYKSGDEMSDPIFATKIHESELEA